MRLTTAGRIERRAVEGRDAPALDVDGLDGGRELGEVRVADAYSRSVISPMLPASAIGQ